MILYARFQSIWYFVCFSVIQILYWFHVLGLYYPHTLVHKTCQGVNGIIYSTFYEMNIKPHIFSL